MGGHAKLSARGNSIASLLSDGDGGVTLVIDQGGEINALLPNLLGLKLGSALLSALGLPEKTDLKCFVADLPLNNGVLSTGLSCSRQMIRARLAEAPSISGRRNLITM